MTTRGDPGRPGLTGARIRARRTERGLTQAGLARAAGISPSYLNLIEHDRRRIGGRVLAEIARALDLSPGALAEGAGHAVLRGLGRAAERGLTAGDGPTQGQGAPGGAPAAPPPERDRLERFAADYPGWAALLAASEARIGALERQVIAMGERMAHDPVLSASVHDILSAVTSIRATAAILVEDDLATEWRDRFHRNVHEDSRRLAERASALAAYLSAGDASARDAASPQEEAESWLAARGWR